MAPSDRILAISEHLTKSSSPLGMELTAGGSGKPKVGFI
jgi:hypothetical protein